MTDTRALLPVLVGGSVVLIVGFGIRAAMGVFQIPVAAEFGWPRAEFSLAIAIQNLVWGIAAPLFSAVAERWGDRRAIMGGAVAYGVGLVLSALATTPGAHQLLAILIGCGTAGMGFGVVLAVVGRAASEANRSMALGIATAAGSLGQVIGPPVAEALLAVMPWQSVFLIFAAAAVLSMLALPLLRAPERSGRLEPFEPMGTVLARAFRDPSFTLIFLGFFSCGYQLGFLTAHFPAFVTELCGPIDPAGMLAGVGVATTSALGAVAVAVIGLANIAGTLAAGRAGRRMSKRLLLAGIYTARTVVSAAFILAPITPASVLVFAAAMGALWLATVPLTSGLVAQLWGLRYMGTLYGVIFLSHQIGGFLGVWLGGRLYDATGGYTLVWWIGIGVGAFSALVHLPVRETPLAARAA